MVPRTYPCRRFGARDFLPKDEVRGGLLGALAVSLASLGAVNPVEADAFGWPIMEDVECVAVKDRDDVAGEVGGYNGVGNKKDPSRNSAASAMRTKLTFIVIVSLACAD